MTTAITAQYTRRIRIDEHYYEIQAGDQVDNSTDLESDWCTVARIGTHADDRDIEDAPDDYYCEGNCAAVFFFEDDDCAFAFHVRPGVEIYARFPVAAE
jgi:hypothetical protein